MIKESSQRFENKETFDFDEFLSHNQFNNILLFERFLKDIFRELSNAKGGISLETFREFINLPSYIADKIFKIFDVNNSKYLNSKNFLEGMLRLFSGNFQSLTKFIFDFYDFDNDGNIIYEDVNQIQLLILPSQHHSEEVFNCIKESLDSFFEEHKTMSYEIFLQITENFNSDIFMNLLIYLYTNKPFSNEIINYYNSDKRISEDTNLINSDNCITNKTPDNIKMGLKKMNTACNKDQVSKSYSISKQYDPLFHLNPKEILNNKSNDNINQELKNNFVNKNSDFEVKSINESSKKLSLSSNNNLNHHLNKHSVNIFYTNNIQENYGNLDNMDSSSSNNICSPKFADKKQKQIIINKNHNKNESSNNKDKNQVNYIDVNQISNQSNSRLNSLSPDKSLGINYNNNSKIDNSNKSSKKSLSINKAKMKIKSPKNNLYLKGIRQNFSRMVTYSDAQHFEESQGIIKEEAADLNEEYDLDYEEYEGFLEPPADETEINDVIIVPQIPSIRNLFAIFRKILSKRNDSNDSNGKLKNKRSLTEEDIMKFKKMPKLENKDISDFTKKIDDFPKKKEISPNAKSKNNSNNSNNLIISTNLTMPLKDNSYANVSSTQNITHNNSSNFNLITYNNDNNHNDENVSQSNLIRNNSPCEKLESNPTINEQFINTFDNRNKTLSKKLNNRTNSISSSHQSITEKNQINKNKYKNPNQNSDINQLASTNQSHIKNPPQPSKKKVISKFYRSYTFNFADKHDLPDESPDKKYKKDNEQKKTSNNNLNVYNNNHKYNKLNRNNTNINNDMRNISNNYNSSNKNNFGYLRKSTFFNNSDLLSQEASTTQRSSLGDFFLSEETLMLRQPAKSTYEAYINKYDQNKDKIIPYYILLNNKMMLYFKNEGKNRFRGLHYLSDANAKASYDKTQTIISNGLKYFYINLSIKGSVKWFVSKTEFEMRKWFEVLKKTINPHKSRQLKDYYLIKETLCEGKYGVVKRCVNKKTKQEVSIKIINMKSLGNDPKKAELIYKELEILRHCNHKSILKYIDHFIENNIEQDKSYVHIVLEYLSGGDLAQFINKYGIMHESRIISLAWDIAKGLEYLHKLGIIHRDIKPENIVFDSMQKPRIVDFGLSQIVCYNEFLTEPYGTYFYASPEIHNKTKYNKATDIWSFGILLYYILTGEYPFERNNGHKEQAHFIICDLEQEFDLERNINFANASRPLKDLISKCLRKNIQQRCSIEEVVQNEVFKKFNGFKSTYNY